MDTHTPNGKEPTTPILRRFLLSIFDHFVRKCPNWLWAILPIRVKAFLFMYD